MAEELKRIDPKTIPALFEKHNIRPTRNSFCRVDGLQLCGCINTILAVDGGGKDAAISIAKTLDTYDEISALLHLSGVNRNYSLGLAQGWDDYVVGNKLAGWMRWPEQLEGDEKAGYDDGQAAWLACQDGTNEEVACG